MPTFASTLIKIGRFLDGFPRLKTDATNTISSILCGIDREPWGISFIFKLGLLLEKGDFSENDEDKRVGRVIVASFSHFKDVRTVAFNREVITADVDGSIRNIKTQRCNIDSSLSEVSIDHCTLKNECERYENLFELFFSEFVERGQDELVTKVFACVQDIQSCTSNDWAERIKSKITEILAGIFARFTYIESGDSFKRFKENPDNDHIKRFKRFKKDPDDEIKCYKEESDNEHNSGKGTNAKNILFRPHNIQIIAILRLLGVGTQEKSLPNHVMDVRTGEGKSIILGALATVLSLLGFSIRCVCYSDYLSERDNDLFHDIFVTFGVNSRIKYCKIDEMSEEDIAKKGDVRQLTVDLIQGNLTKGDSSALLPIELQSGNTSQIIETDTFSVGGLSALPLNGE